MLEVGERIFGKEYTTKQGNSVSHLNQKTNLNVLQLYNDVKILPTGYNADDLQYTTNNTSVLEVVDGHLTPKTIHIPKDGNTSTTVRQIDSIKDNSITFLWEPYTKEVVPNVFEFNDTNTRICMKNKTIDDISITIDMTGINSTPAWNKEPINFIYIHCCVDPIASELKSLDTTGYTWGGGLFLNLAPVDMDINNITWTPLLTSSQIASRVIAIPVTNNSNYIKLMIKGCRSWSLEFLTYITGV